MRFSKPVLVFLVLLSAGCTSSPKQQSAAVPTAAVATSAPAAKATPCDLVPIVVPTPPAKVPGYTELDKSTNLHVTGTAPEIDFANWRLEVVGKVDRPLSLTYDELRCLPKIEMECTLVCPGFFTDVATWAGASLEAVLELAGVRAGAKGLRLYSADGYTTYVSLEKVTKSFVAYEWEGQPLPIIHGFPVRTVFPTLDGNTWAKWLVKIEVE